MNPEEATQQVVTYDENGIPVARIHPVEVEVVRNEPEVPEPPKNYWEQHGFLADIARICSDLEGEREKFLFDSSVRQIIETINNAQRVEDFDRYDDNALNNFIQTLRRRVPEVEREMVSFVNQLTRARAVQVDSVDFI
jgi:hypothetical protein